MVISIDRRLVIQSRRVKRAAVSTIRFVKTLLILHIAAVTGFSVADYGRTLVCTQAHAAHGDNQLSLSVGERVKLLRSGHRGWVLCRTIDDRYDSLRGQPMIIIEFLQTWLGAKPMCST